MKHHFERNILSSVPVELFDWLIELKWRAIFKNYSNTKLSDETSFWTKHFVCSSREFKLDFFQKKLYFNEKWFDEKFFVWKFLTLNVFAAKKMWRKCAPWRLNQKLAASNGRNFLSFPFFSVAFVLYSSSLLIMWWHAHVCFFALADFFCWEDVVCETSGTHTTLISCDNSLFTNGRVMMIDHDFIPLLREKKQLPIAELCPLLCDKLLGSDSNWENDKLERSRQRAKGNRKNHEENNWSFIGRLYDFYPV